MKKGRRFTVIIEQDEDGIYVAEIPQLPGCHTQAQDIPTLMERIREAAELCVSEYDDEIAPMEFVGLQQIDITV
ncbi:MAG: type II toxin-antitoxin system HicB family antitoxin [Deltaproteobacteria bacterium]|nr:type II toxin-antitoxin system HicB family antitoxin [Deltaproteobacteria bacterium]